MPTDKDFKRLVRQGMAGTGERYSQARAALDTRLVDMDPLLAELRDGDWQARRRACQILDDVAFTPQTLAALTVCLEGEHAEVRRAAVQTLTCAHCKPEGCVLDVRDVFARARHDPSRRVRQIIIGSLSWSVKSQICAGPARGDCGRRPRDNGSVHRLGKRSFPAVERYGGSNPM